MIQKTLNNMTGEWDKKEDAYSEIFKVELVDGRATVTTDDEWQSECSEGVGERSICIDRMAEGYWDEVRKRMLHSIRSLILSHWSDLEMGVTWVN